MDGADEMIGGRGDDTHYVNDVVTEYADEGKDSVYANISYTLSANVEDLTLLDFNTSEQGDIDGKSVNIYGFPNLYQLDYAQGDALQGYIGTCALVTISNLLTQSGKDSSEKEVVYRAISEDWAISNPDGDPMKNGNSDWNQQQALLNSYDIDNTLKLGYQEEMMARLVQGGCVTLLGVNAATLWKTAGTTGIVDHVVTVTGVVYDDNNELQGFYIVDSGYREVSDMARYVSTELLKAAADVVNGYMIYTDESIKLWDEDIDGTGNELDNRLIGNRGDNVLTGLAGDDTIEGGNGKDRLLGGAGDDTLMGGADLTVCMVMLVMMLLTLVAEMIILLQEMVMIRLMLVLAMILSMVVRVMTPLMQVVVKISFI